MKPEIKKEITEILDNIIYWDGCPDSYKKRIPELIKELETTKPVNVGLAAVIKCGECKPMEYWIEGIRYYKCQLCGEPM
jgi:hypothetical protein